jgi:hypothetical protein
MINITKTKVAITFAIGIILTQTGGLFVKIPWLFVTSILIGIILIMVTMSYTVYQLVYFLYNKLNENR